MSTDRLACPSCGWDGSSDGENDAWFRLIEPPVTKEYRVEGLNEHGILEVSADVVTVEDDSAGRRLRCGNCPTEFPLPSGIQIEMV
jgi:hypothetical protein